MANEPQLVELEMLESIYHGDVHVSLQFPHFPERAVVSSPVTLRASVAVDPIKSDSVVCPRVLKLEVALIPEYLSENSSCSSPTESIPPFDVFASWLSEETRRAIYMELCNLIQLHSGDPILYIMIDWLKHECRTCLQPEDSAEDTILSQLFSEAFPPASMEEWAPPANDDEPVAMITSSTLDTGFESPKLSTSMKISGDMVSKRSVNAATSSLRSCLQAECLDPEHASDVLEACQNAGLQSTREFASLLHRLIDHLGIPEEFCNKDNAQCLQVQTAAMDWLEVTGALDESWLVACSACECLGLQRSGRFRDLLHTKASAIGMSNRLQVDEDYCVDGFTNMLRRWLEDDTAESLPPRESLVLKLKACESLGQSSCPEYRKQFQKLQQMFGKDVRIERCSSLKQLADAALSILESKATRASEFLRILEAFRCLQLQPSEQAVQRYAVSLGLPASWNMDKIREAIVSAKTLSIQALSDQASACAAFQDLLDLTFKPVVTKDRRSGPMPCRLVVQRVDHVHNVQVWVDYVTCRQRLAQKQCTLVRMADAKDVRRAETNLSSFVVGDVVQWKASDATIKPGELGTVVGIAGERVSVKFCKGTWMFKPQQLKKVSSIRSPITASWLQAASNETSQSFLKNLEPLQSNVNEHYLFHGCLARNVSGIVGNNFRLDLSGTNAGTLYGRGLYFAECASKSDEYAGFGEHGAILVCRVALGNVHYTCDHFPNTGELERLCGRGIDLSTAPRFPAYQSVCGDRELARGTYREFIVFQDDLVYPEFVIHYLREHS